LWPKFPARGFGSDELKGGSCDCVPFRFANDHLAQDDGAVKEHESQDALAFRAKVPSEPMLVMTDTRSFGCVLDRFANDHFAQDDRV
jgi:hypothetical protein